MECLVNLSGVGINCFAFTIKLRSNVTKRSKAKAQLEWLRRAAGPTSDAEVVALNRECGGIIPTGTSS